jgi:Aldehyde dehydrogenase family
MSCRRICRGGRPRGTDDLCGRRTGHEDRPGGDLRSRRDHSGYDDVGEAIKIANDTDLGLSSSVFSADPERAFDVASQIKAGHLSVNRFEIAPSVPVDGLGARARGLETKAVFMSGPA